MMTRRIWIAAVVLLAGCGSGSRSTGDQRPQTIETSHEGHAHAGTPHGQESTLPASPSGQLHALMMRPMQNMQTSGNVDRDFATLMAEHHQQAVDMVDVYLRHAKDPELQRMAEAMRSAQLAEISRLTELAQLAPAAPSAEASSQLHAVMMRPMEGVQLTGNVDADFAVLMAHHHQGAIDMAEIELQSGKSAELRAMAKKMVEDQTREKEQLLRRARG